MDNNLKRAIILDNYENPQNKGLIEDDSYIKINMNNESCIDEIDMMIKVEDNIIKDIRFDGESCAICTSATSIMIKLLLNKSLAEIKIMLDNYNKMINEEIYDEEVLKEANVYKDIAKQPSRKKCALLPWLGIEKLLNKLETK
jgi:nitrogen fixation NifU-like protein